MKAKLTLILLAANAAWSAVPALADDCRTANIHCQGAVAPVAHGAPAVQPAAAKDGALSVPDAGDNAVGGGDAYKTQSGKREQRDSIDAWYRGG